MSILASTEAICLKTFRAGSPAKAVRLRASQGREEVATEVPTPDCNSCPLERSRSEIRLQEREDNILHTTKKSN